MVNAREIEGRIESVQNVKQITRTMKAVASAKLNRAQNRIERARDYAHEMESVIRELLARHPGIEHDFFHGSAEDGVLPDEEDTHPAYLIMTGDRGLCGSYNSNVFSRAEKCLENSADPTLYIVGKTGIDYFNRHEGPIEHTYSNIWEDLDYEYTFNISDRLIEDYLNTEITSVTLIYQEFQSAMVQHVREYPLLPLNRTDFYGHTPRYEEEAEDEDELETDELQFDYEYEPNAEGLVNRLFPRHVRTQVYTQMLEAFAALQGARMVAMDNATENAKEMVEDLTLEYNQARQSAITREIADITGGAEALRNE